MDGVMKKTVSMVRAGAILVAVCAAMDVTARQEANDSPVRPDELPREYERAANNPTAINFAAEDLEPTAETAHTDPVDPIEAGDDEAEVDDSVPAESKPLGMDVGLLQLGSRTSDDAPAAAGRFGFGHWRELARVVGALAVVIGIVLLLATMVRRLFGPGISGGGGGGRVACSRFSPAIRSVGDIDSFC